MCVSFQMGGKRDWVMLSLLIVGLSPLGHCAALKGGKNLDSLNVLNTSTQRTRLLGNRAGDEKPQSKVRPGKLIIGVNESAHENYHNIPEGMQTGNGSPHESGYQSDQAAWSDLQHLQGSVYGFGVANSPAVQQLLGMRPKVECTENYVRLKVHGGIGAFGNGLLIDRGNVPPLPLSRVPLECGFQIQRRWRDLDFIVPYDGCYVSQERDAYIIPIRLCGLAAKLSCPLLNLAPSPPSVSCYPNGMIVKTQNVAPLEDLWVKVENQWQPLLEASPKCGYSIVSHPEGVVISAPYKPCMEAKDEMYSLHMAAKIEFSLFCPSLVPGLPLNLSSLLLPSLSDGVDGFHVKVMPTDASPVPIQRTTSRQWFGLHQRYRLNSVKSSLTPKQPAIPDKPSWTGPLPTSVPSAITLATPQNVPGMHQPQFPETWYPPYPRLTPAPPAVPQKPKPVQVTRTSTSRTVFPDPSSGQLGDLGYSPPEVPQQTALPKLEAVRPPVPPDTVPFLYSGDYGSVNPPESIFVPAAQPHPPQYPQASVLFPTVEPFAATGVPESTGYHWTPSQMPPKSDFPKGHHLPYPPQYPQGPVLSPTVEPFAATGVPGSTGYHWTPSQMPPESDFPQRHHWPYPHQYSQRSALSLTFPSNAAPFEASSVLGAAGSHYQDISQTSNPLGYPQCCQSPVMYSNCCPPSVIYHQHNHHHFGFSNPSFNHVAASRSTRNLTSKAYHFAHSVSGQKLFATQNWGNNGQLFGSLQLKDEMHQAARKHSGRAPPLSHHFGRLMKPTARTQMIHDSSVPPTKPFWASQVLPLSGSSQNTPNAIPFAQLGNNDKPKPGSAPYFGEFSAEYSGTNPQQVPQENAGLNLVEGRSGPSLSTSRQTHLDHYMFLPHESSQPNYRDPVNLRHPVYNNPPTYSLHDPSTQAVPQGSETRTEQRMQDPSLNEINRGISKQTQGSQPPVQPSAYSQEQFGLPNAPSFEHAPDRPSMPLLQMLTGPFQKRWVPVVPSNQVARTEFVHPHSTQLPLNYQPHGPV